MDEYWIRQAARLEKAAALFYDQATWAAAFVAKFPAGTSTSWAAELRDACLAEFRQISRDLANGYGWDGSDAD